MKRDPWLSTYEAVEAVLSLEMVSETLPKVFDNIHYWKWVLIALHNALQGYMVLALARCGSFNILTKKSAEEQMAAETRDDDVLPERKLDHFLNLYKKIKADRLMMMYVDSQPFKPHGTQTQSVKMLNKLRNEYIHFLPKSWVLGVHGLPRVAGDCIDIIEFLAFDCRNILWHDTHLETKTKDLIAQAKSHLALLNQSYCK
jgi:hypothetical protein